MEKEEKSLQNTPSETYKIKVIEHLTPKHLKLLEGLLIHRMSKSKAIRYAHISPNRVNVIMESPIFKKEYERIKKKLEERTLEKVSKNIADKVMQDKSVEETIAMAKIASPQVMDKFVTIALEHPSAQRNLEAGKEILMTAGITSRVNKNPLVQLNINVDDGIFNALKKAESLGQSDEAIDAATITATG